jgi:hypothetical protein
VNSIHRYLLLFIHSQLVVTIVALPILIYWGLSLSVMTFIGNFIFAPVLSLFILLGAIFFFFELLSIPNEFLAEAINRLVLLWDSILKIGKKEWLVEFAHPGIWVLTSIFCMAFLILKCKIVCNMYRKIIVMVVILAGSTSYLFYKKSGKKELLRELNLCNNKFFVVSCKEANTKEYIFIDNGYFNSKKSLSKTITFELKPFLTKIYGTLLLRELVLLHPGQRSFEGAEAFCKVFQVKKVIIPAFKNGLSKAGWSCFFKLKKLLSKQDICLFRVHRYFLNKI